MVKKDKYSRRDFLFKAPQAIVSGTLASLFAGNLPTGLRKRYREAPKVPEGSIYTPIDKNSAL